MTTELPRIKWPQYFLDRFGGQLPDDYITFDVETTGFDPRRDLIVQWGHKQITGRKVDDAGSDDFFINWFEGGLVPEDEVRFLIRKSQRSMTLSDKATVIDEERMRSGRDPMECLPHLFQLFNQWKQQKTLLVGHNAVAFDYRMLDAMFSQFSVGELTIDDDHIFDTGAIVKALVSEPSGKLVPRLGETALAYSRRLIYSRQPGVKWGLDGPEVAKFDVERFGVKTANYHESGNDSLAVHGIFETFRGLIDIVGTRPTAGPAARTAQKTPSSKKQSTTTDPAVATRKVRRQRNR